MMGTQTIRLDHSNDSLLRARLVQAEAIKSGSVASAMAVDSPAPLAESLGLISCFDGGTVVTELPPVALDDVVAAVVFRRRRRADR